MKKLKLIIADTDRFYLEDLERYMLRKHSQSFELHSFTGLELLNGYLEQPGQTADLLLLGEEFQWAAQSGCRQGIRIYLSESGNPDENGKELRIYKYQHVEKLVSELFAAYSQSGNKNFIPELREAPWVIGLYSSAGGSGKSSIAACASMLCAGRGSKVLYLNLESVSSTPDFFNGSSDRSFSSVIYYLKEKSGTLAVKLEGARSVDPDNGVCFFSPPESSCDMEELSFDDTELLFSTLKNAAGYEFIFVDLSCGFSARNAAALKACDAVIRVRDAKGGYPGREALVIRELEQLKEKIGLDLESKSLTVINRWSEGPAMEEGSTIGYYPEMERGAEYRLANRLEFTRDVAALLNRLPEGGGAFAGT